MTFEEMVSLVRRGLGVASSYEDVEIPALVDRSVNRLLRDYNFPKSVRLQEFTNLFADSQEYTLPAGFKRVLELRFFNPTTGEWSEKPLEKVGARVLPSPYGYPSKYWLEGPKLVTDSPISAEMVGWTLQLYYQSMDAATNRDWMVVDFESALHYFSIVRGAAEMRKTEVMQAYAPLWQDERESLAIYLNELEWDNVQLVMREARPTPSERYPR